MSPNQAISITFIIFSYLLVFIKKYIPGSIVYFVLFCQELLGDLTVDCVNINLKCQVEAEDKMTMPIRKPLYHIMWPFSIEYQVCDKSV